MKVAVRGQIEPMKQTLTNLGIGLLVAVLVIYLLLAANFQSLRLAFVVLSTVPAVICGVLFLLFVTRTSLNIQSFMGAIMAIGVAVANAILLVTFAEEYRRTGNSAIAAAIHGAKSRMRPILMTSLAMIAGMVPMALGLGEGSQQTAPLARAVIGGCCSLPGPRCCFCRWCFPSCKTGRGCSHRRSILMIRRASFAAKGPQIPNSLPGGAA